MTPTRVLALAVPLLAANAVAQQATFKAAVDLVSVDVLVTARGKAVTGLAVSDFQLLDNKVPQKIVSIGGDGTGVAAVSRIPLDVVLVFDVSGSMAGDRLAQLVGASQSVLAMLGPEDRAGLVTFSQRTTIRQPLASDVAVVSRALTRVFALGWTSMADALYTGLSLRQASDTRAMVLLFSDGRDNSSWLSLKQVQQVARESDVVVYAVGLDDGVKDDMKDIAEETGGAVIVVESAKDLKPLFERIVREMQVRYVLSYYPNGVAKDGWHPVEVRVPGKRADVVARRGYWRR